MRADEVQNVLCSLDTGSFHVLPRYQLDWQACLPIDPANMCASDLYALAAVWLRRVLLSEYRRRKEREQNPSHFHCWPPCGVSPTAWNDGRPSDHRGQQDLRAKSHRGPPLVRRDYRAGDFSASLVGAVSACVTTAVGSRTTERMS